MKRLICAVIFALALFMTAPVSNADPLVFVANLSGPAEAPPNASPGTGFARITIDPIAHTMRVEVSFSGLLGTTTASHIHAPTAVAGTGTAGVATLTPAFTGFPLGVTAGSLDHTFDMTLTASYNAPFVTANGGTAAGAEAVLFSAIMSGQAYFNIHTTTVPGGEIRGFLVATPEPTTMLLFGTGLAVAYRIKRRRKVRN